MEVKTKSPNGQAIVAQLDQLFRASVKHLRDDIEAYIAEGTLPDPAARTTGRYAYPEIHLTWSGDTDSAEPQRSFGRLPAPGHYVTSVTKPSLFGDYLAEQIDILIADYGVVVEAREGRQEIPFPYVLDAGTEFGDVRAIDLARWFPSTELSAIGDEIADGLLTADPACRTRCPYLMGCGLIFHSPGCAITQAPRLSMCSVMCCSPIIIAMWMNLSAGRAANWAMAAAIPCCPAPAA